MGQAYRVTGQYVTVKVKGQYGEEVRAFSRNAMLPDGVSQEMIRHLLSVRMIEPVFSLAPPPPPREPEEPEEPPQPAVDPRVEAERAAARAKLPPDGSPPDGRASKAVWIEWLVGRGYSYDALVGLDKKDLVDMASNLS